MCNKLDFPSSCSLPDRIILNSVDSPIRDLLYLESSFASITCYQRPDLLVRHHCSRELLNWAELLVNSMVRAYMQAPESRWGLPMTFKRLQHSRIAKCVAKINSVLRSNRTSSDFVVCRKCRACGSSNIMTTGLTHMTIWFRRCSLGAVPERRRCRRINCRCSSVRETTICQIGFRENMELIDVLIMLSKCRRCKPDQTVVR